MFRRETSPQSPRSYFSILCAIRRALFAFGILTINSSWLLKVPIVRHKSENKRCLFKEQATTEDFCISQG